MEKIHAIVVNLAATLITPFLKTWDLILFSLFIYFNMIFLDFFRENRVLKKGKT